MGGIKCEHASQENACQNAGDAVMLPEFVPIVEKVLAWAEIACVRVDVQETGDYRLHVRLRTKVRRDSRSVAKCEFSIHRDSIRLMQTDMDVWLKKLWKMTVEEMWAELGKSPAAGAVA